MTTSNSDLTEADIVAHDCRRACIHELAHAVVAREAVGPLLINISPQIDGPGEASPRRVNGNMLFDSIFDPKARAAVGWAGYVGEMLEIDLNLTSDLILELFPPSRRDLSQSDWKLIASVGKGQRQRAMDTAIATILANWPEVLMILNALEHDYRSFGFAMAAWDGQWHLTDGRIMSVRAQS